MKPQLITIVGNIAAGKSSALNLVADVVGGKVVKADDLFQTSDPFREDYLHDIPRWALANELWLTKERVKIIEHSLEANGKKYLVVDSGLLMSWVYTYSHFLTGKITKHEWELYEDLFTTLANGLVTNGVVVYLDYPIETLMYRLKLRGRDYELEYYTRDYLLQLQAGLRALTVKLKRERVKVICVTENDVPDFVERKKDKNKMRALVSAEFQL